MLRSRHMMGLVALAGAGALVAGACGTDSSGGSGRQASATQPGGAKSPPVAAAVAAMPPATAAQHAAPPFHAATEAAQLRRAGRPAAMSGVRFSQETQDGRRFDRIVFAFTGDSAAGYHVAYTDKPVRQCGSGQPVSVAGSAHLVVRLEPAQAHDEGGNPTPANRALTVRLPVVKDMKLTCDFEGQVEWVLGLAGKYPFRVTELTGPPRLAIDVAHPE